MSDEYVTPNAAVIEADARETEMLGKRLSSLQAKLRALKDYFDSTKGHSYLRERQLRELASEIASVEAQIMQAKRLPAWKEEIVKRRRQVQDVSVRKAMNDATMKIKEQILSLISACQSISKCHSRFREDVDTPSDPCVEGDVLAVSLLASSRLASASSFHQPLGNDEVDFIQFLICSLQDAEITSAVLTAPECPLQLVKPVLSRSAPEVIEGFDAADVKTLCYRCLNQYQHTTLNFLTSFFPNHVTFRAFGLAASIAFSADHLTQSVSLKSFWEENVRSSTQCTQSGKYLLRALSLGFFSPLEHVYLSPVIAVEHLIGDKGQSLNSHNMKLLIDMLTFLYENADVYLPALPPRVFHTAIFLANTSRLAAQKKLTSSEDKSQKDKKSGNMNNKIDFRTELVSVMAEVERLIKTGASQLSDEKNSAPATDFRLERLDDHLPRKRDEEVLSNFCCDSRQIQNASNLSANDHKKKVDISSATAHVDVGSAIFDEVDRKRVSIYSLQNDFNFDLFELPKLHVHTMGSAGAEWAVDGRILDIFRVEPPIPVNKSASDAAVVVPQFKDIQLTVAEKLKSLENTTSRRTQPRRPTITNARPHVSRIQPNRPSDRSSAVQTPTPPSRTSLGAETLSNTNTNADGPSSRSSSPLAGDAPTQPVKTKEEMRNVISVIGDTPVSSDKHAYRARVPVELLYERFKGQADADGWQNARTRFGWALAPHCRHETAHRLQCVGDESGHSFGIIIAPIEQAAAIIESRLTAAQPPSGRARASSQRRRQRRSTVRNNSAASKRAHQEKALATLQTQPLNVVLLRGQTPTSAPYGSINAAMIGSNSDIGEGSFIRSESIAFTDASPGDLGVSLRADLSTSQQALAFDEDPAEEAHPPRKLIVLKCFMGNVQHYRTDPIALIEVPNDQKEILVECAVDYTRNELSFAVEGECFGVAFDAPSILCAGANLPPLVPMATFPHIFIERTAGLQLHRSMSTKAADAVTPPTFPIGPSRQTVHQVLFDYGVATRTTSIDYAASEASGDVFYADPFFVADAGYRGIEPLEKILHMLNAMLLFGTRMEQLAMAITPETSLGGMLNPLKNLANNIVEKNVKALLNELEVLPPHQVPVIPDIDAILDEETNEYSLDKNVRNLTAGGFRVGKRQFFGNDNKTILEENIVDSDTDDTTMAGDAVWRPHANENEDRMGHIIPQAKSFSEFSSTVQFNLLSTRQRSKVATVRVRAQKATPLGAALHLNLNVFAKRIAESPFCNVNIPDEQGNTPLMLAVLKGLPDMVRFLLYERSANVTLTNYAGYNVVHIAMLCGQWESLDLLLKHPTAITDCEINAATPYKSNCVVLAVKLRRLAYLTEFLRRGGDASKVDCFNSNALLYTLKPGIPPAYSEEVLKYVHLFKPIDVNCRERYGDRATPLLLASSVGNIAACRALLERGASVPVLFEHNKCNALHSAIIAGSDPCAELILTHALDNRQQTWDVGEASVNMVRVTFSALLSATEARHGMTPLHLACDRGLWGTMNLLLANGSDVNALSRTEQTPLMILASGPHQDHACHFIKLAKKNIKVDICDKAGNTVLIYAVQQGHTKLVEMLIDSCRAEVNTVNKAGYSALTSGIQFGQIACVDLILQLCGKRVDISSARGNVPFPADLALSKGHLHLAKMLSNLGGATSADFSAKLSRRESTPPPTVSSAQTPAVSPLPSALAPAGGGTANRRRTVRTAQLAIGSEDDNTHHVASTPHRKSSRVYLSEMVTQKVALVGKQTPDVEALLLWLQHRVAAQVKAKGSVFEFRRVEGLRAHDKMLIAVLERTQTGVDAADILDIIDSQSAEKGGAILSPPGPTIGSATSRSPPHPAASPLVLSPTILVTGGGQLDDDDIGNTSFGGPFPVKQRTSNPASEASFFCGVSPVGAVGSRQKDLSGRRQSTASAIMLPTLVLSPAMPAAEIAAALVRVFAQESNTVTSEKNMRLAVNVIRKNVSALIQNTKRCAFNPLAENCYEWDIMRNDALMFFLLLNHRNAEVVALLRNHVRVSQAEGKPVNPNAITRSKWAGRNISLLHAAILTENVEAVHFLLELGSDPSININAKPSPLVSSHQFFENDLFVGPADIAAAALLKLRGNPPEDGGARASGGIHILIPDCLACAIHVPGPGEGSVLALSTNDDFKTSELVVDSIAFHLVKRAQKRLLLANTSTNVNADHALRQGKEMTATTTTYLHLLFASRLSTRTMLSVMQELLTNFPAVEGGPLSTLDELFNMTPFQLAMVLGHQRAVHYCLDNNRVTIRANSFIANAGIAKACHIAEVALDVCPDLTLPLVEFGFYPSCDFMDEDQDETDTHRLCSTTTPAATSSAFDPHLARMFFRTLVSVEKAWASVDTQGHLSVSDVDTFSPGQLHTISDVVSDHRRGNRRASRHLRASRSMTMDLSLSESPSPHQRYRRQSAVSLQSHPKTTCGLPIALEVVAMDLLQLLSDERWNFLAALVPVQDTSLLGKGDSEGDGDLHRTGLHEVCRTGCIPIIESVLASACKREQLTAMFLRPDRRGHTPIDFLVQHWFSTGAQHCLLGICDLLTYRQRSIFIESIAARTHPHVLADLVSTLPNMSLMPLPHLIAKEVASILASNPRGAKRHGIATQSTADTMPLFGTYARDLADGNNNTSTSIPPQAEGACGHLVWYGLAFASILGNAKGRPIQKRFNAKTPYALLCPAHLLCSLVGTRAEIAAHLHHASAARTQSGENAEGHISAQAQPATASSFPQPAKEDPLFREVTAGTQSHVWQFDQRLPLVTLLEGMVNEKVPPTGERKTKASGERASSPAARHASSPSRSYLSSATISPKQGPQPNLTFDIFTTRLTNVAVEGAYGLTDPDDRTRGEDMSIAHLAPYAFSDWIHAVLNLAARCDMVCTWGTLQHAHAQHGKSGKSDGSSGGAKSGRPAHALLKRSSPDAAGGTIGTQNEATYLSSLYSPNHPLGQHSQASVKLFQCKKSVVIAATYRRHQMLWLLLPDTRFAGAKDAVGTPLMEVCIQDAAKPLKLVAAAACVKVLLYARTAITPGGLEFIKQHPEFIGLNYLTPMTRDTLLHIAVMNSELAVVHALVQDPQFRLVLHRNAFGLRSWDYPTSVDVLETALHGAVWAANRVCKARELVEGNIRARAIIDEFRLRALIIEADAGSLERARLLGELIGVLKVADNPIANHAPEGDDPLDTDYPDPSEIIEDAIRTFLVKEPALMEEILAEYEKKDEQSYHISEKIFNTLSMPDHVGCPLVEFDAAVLSVRYIAEQLQGGGVLGKTLTKLLAQHNAQQNTNGAVGEDAPLSDTSKSATQDFSWTISDGDLPSAAGIPTSVVEAFKTAGYIVQCEDAFGTTGLHHDRAVLCEVSLPHFQYVTLLQQQMTGVESAGSSAVPGSRRHHSLVPHPPPPPAVAATAAAPGPVIPSAHTAGAPVAGIHATAAGKDPSPTVPLAAAVGLHFQGITSLRGQIQAALAARPALAPLRFTSEWEYVLIPAAVRKRLLLAHLPTSLKDTVIFKKLSDILNTRDAAGPSANRRKSLFIEKKFSHFVHLALAPTYDVFATSQQLPEMLSLQTLMVTAAQLQ